ncbi:hypothetical protein HMSSN139_65790 [Paenibacillus sp. HMSSN-139]|nr:hypothetical protein HMSSN139_65790 [Paenibacillus sp. HMSSN-139]
MEEMAYLGMVLKALKRLEYNTKGVSAETALRTTADFIGLELSRCISCLETVEQMHETKNDRCGNSDHQ